MYEPRDVDLAKRSVALGFLDIDAARRILYEATRRGQSFEDALRVGGVLEPGAIRRLLSPRSDTHQPSLGPPRLPEIGESIAGFRIVELLGRGGMGSVYRGRSGETDVAIKLATGAFRRETLVRFRREAQTLAAVDRHPHIVGIHQYGEHHGLPFFIQDYIAGESLADRLKRGEAVKLDEALSIARAIALALDFVHERGIVHRDIKPANILVRSEDGCPFLTDFGLMKRLEAESLTQSGALVGTPMYMAPEQIRNDRKAIGPATDIWGLGVVLYELVTGRRPFLGESIAVLYDEIIKTGVLPAGQVRPGVPKAVDRILERALNKKAAARYERGEDMAADLERALNALAASAGPRRTRTLPRRSGLWRRVAVSALAVLLLAAAVAGGLALKRRSEKRRSVEEAADALLTLLRGHRRDRTIHAAYHLSELGGFEDLSELWSAEGCRAWSEVGALRAALAEVRSAEPKLYESAVPLSVRRGLEEGAAELGGLEELAAAGASSESALVRAAVGLRSDPPSAAGFESLPSRDRGLAELGRALAAARSGRWEEARRRFQGLSEDRELRAFGLFLSRRADEQAAFAGLFETGGRSDRLEKRLERLVKGWKSGDWRRWNSRVARRFSEARSAAEQEACAEAYGRLAELKRRFKALREPRLTPWLCLRMAERAAADGRRARAYFHYLAARRLDPGVSLPEAYRPVAIRGVLTDSMLKRDKVEALEDFMDLLVEAGRAGLYLPYFNVERLTAARRRGYFKAAIADRPDDPILRFWRSFAPDPSARSKLEKDRSFAQRLADLEYVVNAEGVAPIFVSKALMRRARLRWARLSLSKASADRKEAVLVANEAELRRALELPCPEPDFAYLELARVAAERDDHRAVLDLLDKAEGVGRERLLRSQTGQIGEGPDKHWSPYLEEEWAVSRRTIARRRCQSLIRLERYEEGVAAARAALKDEADGRLIDYALRGLTALGRFDEAREMMARYDEPRFAKTIKGARQRLARAEDG